MSAGRDDRAIDELTAALGLTPPGQAGPVAGHGGVPPQRAGSRATSAPEAKQAAIALAAALRRCHDRDDPDTGGDAALPALAATVRRLRGLGRDDAVLRALCDEAATVTGLERVALTVPAPAGGWCVLHARDGGRATPGGLPEPDAPDPSFAVRPGSGAALALTTGAPATAATPASPARPGGGPAPGGHYVVAPIPGARTPAGLLHADHDPPRPVTAREVAALAALAEVVAPVWHGGAVAARWEERVTAVSGLLTTVLTEAHDGREDGRDGPRPRADHEPALETLTPRERVVLDHLLAGHANREIATALVLSVETVKTHVKKVLRKLGAADRADLISRTYWDSTT